MNVLIRFYQSSIGKKWVVALTGLVLIAYVVGHLCGNLQIFIGANHVGPKQINKYAEFLHSLGPILWVIRAFLLGCFGLHVLTTILISRENRAARPERYALNTSVQATLSARTMILSGLIVLSFVVFHLMQFTIRNTPDFAAIETQMSGEYDCYNMVILAFRNPIASGFYILGLFLLCSHLSHGFQSFVQTLGLTSRRWSCCLEAGSSVLAWLIFAAYISIPVSVLLHRLNPVLQ